MVQITIFDQFLPWQNKAFQKLGACWGPDHATIGGHQTSRAVVQRIAIRGLAGDQGPVEGLSGTIVDGWGQQVVVASNIPDYHRQ